MLVGRAEEQTQHPCGIGKASGSKMFIYSLTYLWVGACVCIPQICITTSVNFPVPDSSQISPLPLVPNLRTSLLQVLPLNFWEPVKPARVHMQNNSSIGSSGHFCSMTKLSVRFPATQSLKHCNTHTHAHTHSTTHKGDRKSLSPFTAQG